MLKALYDYGVRNGLSIPPGFMKKSIRDYICLSAEGEYLGILQCGDETQICPDIGSAANSPDKCNPLAEKESIILGDKEKKREFFKKLLAEGAGAVPQFKTCLDALENPEIFEAMRADAEQMKIKKEDRISFRVDGVSIVLAEGVHQWWTDYRKTLGGGTGKKNDGSVRCLITGELITPVDTVPVQSGLADIGANPKGVPLLCFDKAAYQSYGLKKSANAPVSEEAFSVVKDALNDLIAGSPAMYSRSKNRRFNPTAPTYAGMKFLHWYDCGLAPEEDPILPAFSGFGEEEDEEGDTLSEEEARELARKEEIRAKANADRLVGAVQTGEKVPLLSARYYILLVSANKGRVIVRRYEQGSYETLQKNLKLWNEDLALQDASGSGELRPCKLSARLIRLVKDQGKTGKSLFDQMKKELAGITPVIITAILNGTVLPDAVAVRALSYIRSQMLSGGSDDKKTDLPDGRACQWLKVWLARKRRARNEEVLSMSYDNQFPSAAYHCGALTAIYVCLQNVAMGNVNASIVQRYYASASRTPTLVLGTLERMGQVYLGMLSKEKKGTALAYQNRLNEVYAFFGKDGLYQLPASLNLEEQSFFALGYRQMYTKIMAEIAAAAAAKKEEK